MTKSSPTLVSFYHCNAERVARVHFLHTLHSSSRVSLFYLVLPIKDSSFTFWAPVLYKLYSEPSSIGSLLTQTEQRIFWKSSISCRLWALDQNIQFYLANLDSNKCFKLPFQQLFSRFNVSYNLLLLRRDLMLCEQWS